MKRKIMLTLIMLFSIAQKAYAADEGFLQTNYLWIILGIVVVVFVIIFITTVIGNKKDR